MVAQFPEVLEVVGASSGVFAKKFPWEVGVDVCWGKGLEERVGVEVAEDDAVVAGVF